jgi:MFS family permease
MGKYLSRDLKILSLAFFFMFMGASFQQFLVPYLQETTSWGTMKCSAILMMVYSALLFWRIFVNYSIPALGDYRSIVLGSVTYSGFVATLYLTKQYPLIMVAAFVWGWGAASMWIVSSTQVLDAARESAYGRASGIFYAATHAGFAVGVVILGRMGDRFGRDAVLLSALAAMVTGNVVMLFVPRKRVQRETDIRIIFSMIRKAKVKIVGFFLFASALGFGFLLGVFTGVAEENNLAYLANTAVFFPIARLIISFSGGIISDKLGRARTLIFAFIISCLGMFFAGIWSNMVTVGFSAFSLGLQGGLVPVAAMAIIGDSAVKERRHLAFSALFVWRDLGVVFSLFLGQYLRVLLGGFRPCFLVFAGIFLVCVVLSVILVRRETEAL